jgi:hypothetical protein
MKTVIILAVLMQPPSGPLGFTHVADYEEAAAQVSEATFVDAQLSAYSLVVHGYAFARMFPRVRRAVKEAVC